MSGDESADDADVGLEDGGVDVDVEVVEIVDHHLRHATELAVVSHHHQRVQSVDQGQLRIRVGGGGVRAGKNSDETTPKKTCFAIHLKTFKNLLKTRVMF